MRFATLFPVLGGLASLTSAICIHNYDAGYWHDNATPASVVEALCHQGGGCRMNKSHSARICVIGEIGNCGAAIEYAEMQQSWHEDWWLWSAIVCNGLTITMTPGENRNW